MHKVAISGGPHTGKTTLLSALHEALPTAFYVDEPATNVISTERQLEAINVGHVGRFPWNNYAEFGELVVAESLRLEAAIPDDVQVAILDRCLIDTVAYARLNNCDFLVPKVKQLIKTARYTTALFCDFVGEYTTSTVRSETLEEARKTHDYLLEAYEEADITIVRIPPVNVAERLELVRDTLATM
jgi:predicted ATPase